MQLLGRGLAQLPREQVYVATKVGKYRAGDPEDFSAERVKRSVHESLERLGALSLWHTAGHSPGARLPAVHGCCQNRLSCDR